MERCFLGTCHRQEEPGWVLDHGRFPGIEDRRAIGPSHLPFVGRVIVRTGKWLLLLVLSCCRRLGQLLNASGSGRGAKRCLVPIPLNLTRFSPLEFICVSSLTQKPVFDHCNSEVVTIKDKRLATEMLLMKKEFQEGLFLRWQPTYAMPRRS